MAAGLFAEDPKKPDWRARHRVALVGQALDGAMNFRGPPLVNVVTSQDSARKPRQFRWHS